MLHSHKEQHGSMAASMMLHHNSYTSNGFDVARIASYKSELRRLSERFYVRAASGVGGECGGAVGLRRCFLVRDLRGGVWKVQHRGNLEGVQAVRHWPKRGGPVADCQRVFNKNRVLLVPKGPLLLPDKQTSGNPLRGQQSQRTRKR